jgi:LPS export ABC transporter protein LptC
MKYSAFALLAGLLILPACKNDLASIENAFPPEAAFREEILNFEMLYSDSSRVRVKVQGPVLWRHLDEENPRQEFPKGIEVIFYDPNLRVNSRLTANSAVRQEKENQIVVRDSVVWQGLNDERLETEELIWDEKARKVFSHKFVVIRRRDEIIWGHGFESDQDFSRSRIKAIEGRIKVEDQQGE